MKKIATLVLAAAMLLGASNGAKAVDFKAHGEWIFGFGVADTAYYNDEAIGNGADTFAASQRVRLQIEAIASESLSGALFLEIGEQYWGNAKTGGSLGTDEQVVEVRRAYIDWIVPTTSLSLRMGLQYFGNPAVAGGSAVIGADGAGIAANYKINDMVGVSLAWLRPYNDNYVQQTSTSDSNNYLDNMDFFMLSVPVKGSNWSVTPWIMGGAMGKNTGIRDRTSTNDYRMRFATRIGLFGTHAETAVDHAPAYTPMIWAGIPISFTHDAFNFELDVNYGSVGYSGTYNETHRNGNVIRVDRQRSGWLIKALAEYKMDWGTPGIFAWYGSGDDSNISNGSERMPVLGPSGTFTSFFGDDPWSFASEANFSNTGFDQMLGYDGTWGIGLQLKNFSFMEKLSHTFRMAYWGGTNHTENAKYLSPTDALNLGGGTGTFYLTTADYMVEFNLDSTYKIYDNLTATLQLGYAINGIDKDTWDYQGGKRDGYKAGLVMRYAF